LLGGALPEEATMTVFMNHLAEGIYGIDGRCGLITVPLEILAHPVDTPVSTSFYVGCLGNGMLHGLTWFSTLFGTNLKQLDALPRQSKCHVDFIANVRRRPSVLEKGLHRLRHSRPLDLG
jgi:hypothetical protein